MDAMFGAVGFKSMTSFDLGENFGNASTSYGIGQVSKEAMEKSREIIAGTLQAKKEELESIVESTAAQEEQLSAKRAEYTARIDERTLSAYDRIRGSVRNHLAVVTVYNENACGGCFNTITPQRLVDIASGRKLVICEHCGRILVNPLAEVQE